MSRKTITARSVSIYLEPEELQSAGLGPSPEDCDLRALVRRELASHGQKVWLQMELDVFGGVDGGLLLIARPLPDTPLCLRFKDFEDLICAVNLCSDAESSELSALDGDYYLVLDCQAEPPPGVFEFGEPVHASEAVIAHLREHGACILHRDAVLTLQKHFFR